MQRKIILIRITVIFCVFLFSGLSALRAGGVSSPASTISFHTAAGKETVVSITASAPGAAWDLPGAEAAIATIYIDGH